MVINLNYFSLPPALNNAASRLLALSIPIATLRVMALFDDRCAVDWLAFTWTTFNKHQKHENINRYAELVFILVAFYQRKKRSYEGLVKLSPTSTYIIVKSGELNSHPRWLDHQ
jgi:hypothetical protein